jgi:hypothetical protein
MNFPRKLFFPILLALAAGVWLYDIALLTGGHSSKQSKPEGTLTGVSLSMAKHVYKADFADPFFCKELMAPVLPSSHGALQRRAIPIVLPPCSIGGIVYNPGNPMALIVVNGKSQLSKKGDTIDSITVSEIGKDYVKLTYRHKSFTLTK